MTELAAISGENINRAIALQVEKCCQCLPLSNMAQAKSLAYQVLVAWQTGDSALQLESDEQRQIAVELSQKNAHGIQYFYVQHDKLQAARYWYWEQVISDKIKVLLAQSAQANDQQIRSLVKAVFNDSQSDQAVAVGKALKQYFFILNGGPGTGKTFTMARLLYCLQQLNKQSLNVALCAPTGKAAQRMTEALTDASMALPTPLTITSGQTIHKLLGRHPTTGKCRYNQNMQLDFDVIMVDEASMLDTQLCYQLLMATKPDARIILIGDAMQLPSIEVGQVLHDLVSVIPSTHRHTLTHNHRAGRSLNDVASQILHGTDLAWEQIGERVDLQDYDKWLGDFTQRHFEPLLAAQSMQEAWQWLQQARIITPLNIGPYGVRQVNEQIAQLLGKGSDQTLYPYKPVLVTQNHYPLGIYNGDIGLISYEQGIWYLNLPTEKGFRQVALHKVPSYESVFAMTIHKTQGSEFTQVGLLVPDIDSPILNRSLLYTAITRAKEGLSFCADINQLNKMQNNHQFRCTLLAEKINN